MKLKIRNIILWVIPAWMALGLQAQVIQWRGEMRDGHFRNETNLLKEWPEGGPELLLKKEGIGTGYSSPIFANGTIYVTGMKDTLDYLTALDLEGNVKWQVAYGRSWAKSFPDTRSSPTIDGDKVYVLSGSGQLSCLSTSDGSKVWAVNVDADYEAEWHSWGVSESPLIVGNMVLCSPGGGKTSVVAFDKTSGKEIWRTPSIGGQRSYVSPTIYEHNGIRLILATTATQLAGLKPETGEVAWTYNYHAAKEWDSPGLIWANTPIWSGNDIYISKGYDFPSKMLTMNAEATAVSEKFTNTVLDNHHHGVVLVDGYVYASNWISNGKGNWVCMDWQTGDIKWETEWENKGSIIYADGLLYVYDERRGNVGLVRPNPEKFDRISSFRITDGTGPHWAHPFIGDGKLLIRHGDVLMVFNIATTP
jgi:outer membrane protein assembly factor BamB